MGVSDAESPWPGWKFGLPESGPRSVPSWSRRIGGIVFDWLVAVVISLIFFDYSGAWVMGLFLAMHILGGLTLAGSPGHLVFGIRIAPISGGRLGVLAPIVRPLLIALVIPPLLNDSDMRGAHDRLVGTILVSRR